MGYVKISHMHYIRFRFILLLGFLSSLSLCAHEARINPQQRQAIRKLLQNTGCVDAFGKIILEQPRERTRGNTRRTNLDVSRGRTRNISAASTLPDIAEEYNQYFSKIIAAELALPYGKETDPKAHLFFRQEPYEGPEKLQVQEELGIRWNTKDAPTVIPTWLEFAAKYRAALKRRGIDPMSTFTPALVLYKDLGEVVNNTTGKKTMKREYLFIDPLTDSFPEDISLWKILNKDVQFNIPFTPIFEAMQKGKFPLLDAVHDVSHFVSFLRFPEFAQSVRKQMNNSPSVVTSGFKGREYWLTEALSLPDPNGERVNHSFLSKQGRPTKVRSPKEIEKELSRLGDKELVEYSYNLAKHMESQLRDVSGGNSNTAEKWYYLSESFGMSAEDLMNEDISKSDPLPYVMALGKVYFDNAPISLNANPKALTNETATFSFNNLAAAQKLLALSLKEKKDGGFSRKEALDRLVQFTSRTEHLMVTKPFSYEEWTKAFLQNDLPKSEPVAQLMQQVFPNEIVSKYYLGEGQARPAKTN